MQLTLDVLERALSPIEDIGREELVFPVNGVPVTLKVLSPEEETEVHRFSTSEIGDGDESLAAASSFLERLKLGILSYAIIAVGDNDFHDSPFVETGESLGEGSKRVRVPRYMAMRDLIKRWPGAIRTALFRKYVELLDRVEKKAEAAIQFEPADNEVEIERLEKKLKTLREERETAAKSAFSDMVRTAAETEEENSAARAARREARIPVEEPPQESASTPSEAPAAPRRPITPPAAPPPETDHRASVEQAPASVLRAPPPIPPEEDESFVDLSDPEAVQKAMGRENTRLIAMRRGVPIPEPPSAIGRTIPLSRPPHEDAVETVRALGEVAHNPQKPTEAGTLGDRPVFRMPVQEMDSRPGAPEPRTRTPVDDPAAAGKETRNPRFQGMKQP